MAVRRARANILGGLAVLVVLAFASAEVTAADTSTPSAGETPQGRGYRLLTNKPYVPPDFDQEVFDELWKTWEEPSRSKAAKATPEERRRMAFARYGLTESPDRPGSMAMQYTSDGRGGWVLNCLACHGGKVLGRAIPGLPNSHFAMQTLSEEVRAIKLKQRKLSAIEVAAAAFPLGNSNGTTNAVMFGVALGYLRDEDLNVRIPDKRPDFVHHDMDAPPWWNVKKKKYLYADGFSPKSHRALMQFLMVPVNGAAQFREWEADFKDIYAWIESIEPPKYPFAIDHDLAAEGQKVFEQTCSRCHGTYGREWTYPAKIVPIEEVATDRVRLDALTVSQRAGYERSWFGQYGGEHVVDDPGGYVAPPLDGIWASAPYLHNGSVPTLWHLFHAGRRPVVWQRTEDGYDSDKVGLEVATFDELPAGVTDAKQKRRYFDTRLFGKSRGGHLFPDELSEPEKRAVIEYLKTL
ncbi:MAG: cytochrome c [Planctomycetia bacterium]|nr:cytochrome c [Planctomycetia bacterium]